MKKPLSMAALLLAFSLPALIRAEDAPATAAASPYAILESFVGGTWITTLPPQKNGPPVRIELRLAWNENKQGVRFDSTFLMGDKRSPYVSGMYVWNPAKKTLVMIYTDGSGSLTEGPVTVDGEVLMHELTATDKNGVVSNVRVRLTKLGRDAFEDEISGLKDGAWAKIADVKYERKE